MNPNTWIAPPSRPTSDIPDVEVVGQWALTHWIDAPAITITTNHGEVRREFVAPNAAQRTGPPYVFEFPYVLTLYLAAQGDQALQAQIRRNDGLGG